MKKLYRNALFTVFILAAACSCSRDKVVATVNGERITAAMLQAEMEMDRGKYDPIALVDGKNFEEFRQQALDELIHEEILLSEAKRVGLSPSRDDVKEVENMRISEVAGGLPDTDMLARGIDPKIWKKAQLKRITINKLIKQEVMDKIPVPEENIADYYKRHAREFDQPAQFRARQILTDTREVAENILMKLREGKDFAELAKEYSLSPDGKRGGDLGFFDSRTYPPIFSEVCQELKEGETSGVVTTDYGFQIFELLEKRPARKVPFDEARDAILSMLRENESEAAIEKWDAELKGRSKVEIDQNALKEVFLAKEK